MAVIIATGSEVGARARGARPAREPTGSRCAIVSMPSTDGVRPAGRHVQAQRAARQSAAHRGRGRRDRLLVEVPLRRGRRHRPLRRVGARPACCSSCSDSRRRTSPTPCARCCARAADADAERADSHFFDRLRSIRHDHSCSHQRLRPYRPQHPSRPLRGRQEAPDRDRRDQRSGRRQDQCAPDPVRHRARQVPRHGVGRRRLRSSSTATASRCWPTATRPNCPGARSASTWCSSAPASSPARRRPRRT